MEERLFCTESNYVFNDLNERIVGSVGKLSSALLLCKKIARLVNDTEGQEWLSYEYGGYPTTKEGYITDRSWKLAIRHGRSFYSKDKECRIFAELAAELEEAIASNRIALNNYTTQGFSAAGEMALLATDRMACRVAQSTTDLLQTNRINEKRLSILKSQYYDYAVKWQIDLQFGNTAKKIFEEYQEKVSLYFSDLGSEMIYLVDWLEQINNLQSSGVHSDVTREQAMQCIIHTYIALGDILRLKESIR